MKQYDVYFDCKIVGTGYIEESGLYTQLQCNCSLPGDDMYRAVVRIGAETIDVGICIPIGDVFEAKRKLPKKNFPSGKPQFHIIGIKNENVEFVPLDQNKSFAYLDKIISANFAVHSEQIGLWITAGSDS